MFAQSYETLSEVIGSIADDSVRPKTDLFSSSEMDSARRYETFRMPGERVIGLPHVVVAGEGIDDFYANIAAYYSDRSPISAFVHVLDRETHAYFNVKTEEARSVIACDRRLMAFLGASLGETLLAGPSSSEVGILPTYSACRRSLAVTVARAKAIYPTCRANYVISQWIKLRNLTGMGIKESSIEAVRLVHGLGYKDEAQDPIHRQLHNAVSAYIDNMLSDNELGRCIVDLYPQFQSYLEELRGPFDGRMKVFSKLVELIHESSRGRASDDIAIAFLCNRILPGSFDHAKILVRLSAFFPTSLIWYGVFSALSEGFAANKFGSGLIAKLARDTCAPFSFLTRPNCDISLDELEVLTRISLKPEAIRPSQQRIALVGLLPGVDVFSRFSLEEERVAEREREQHFAQAEELNIRLSSILEDALGLLRKNRPSSTYSLSPGGRRVKKTR